MKGKYIVLVSNNKLKYTLEIERNVTVICGNSGTGKTTLINLLENNQRYGTKSGISVQCSRKCVVLHNDNWELMLENTHNSIVFIDEGNEFVRSKEFADSISGSDNYYVIITRESLPQIPYSVDAVLELKKTSSRFKKTYNRTYPYYRSIPKSVMNSNCSTVITEDSGAGYQMYSKIADKFSLKCVSANGKSNIASLLDKYTDSGVLIIADGAAFGPEMQKIYLKMSEMPDKIFIYLPESFEWVILKSGIVGDKNTEEILEKPYEYIESELYLSWEQFFTDYLQKITAGTEFCYLKNKLTNAYFAEMNVMKIMDVVKEK